MRNKRRISRKRLDNIKIPKIPRKFLQIDSIAKVIKSTLDAFCYEEQQIIYLYCFTKLPTNKIAAYTGLTQAYVTSILIIYSERLAFKLKVFKEAIDYDLHDMATTAELMWT